MGIYHSCHINLDPAHTCDSYFQDSMHCIDDNTKDVYLCWNNPTRVAYVAVPFLLLPFLIFFIYLAHHFRQLYTIRRQQISTSDQVATLYGKYAGGWNDYTLDRDILPYIVPKYLRTWCIIERLEYRIIFVAALMMIFLGCVFIPYGMGTHEQVDPGLFNNSYHLATAGLVLGVLGGVLCCVLMCFQSNRSWREERARKYQELMPVSQRGLLMQDVPMAQHQQLQLQGQQPRSLHNPYIPVQQQPLAYVAPTSPSLQHTQQNNSTAVMVPAESQV